MEILGNIWEQKKEENHLYCKSCDVLCSNKYNFQRHLLTAKHGQEIISGAKKEQPLFQCKICSIMFTKKSNLKRHCQTQNHFGNMEEQMEEEKGNICKTCNKEFKTYSGLWKHNKICTKEETNKLNNDLILEIMKQNQEFKQLLFEQMKVVNVVDNSIHHSNSHNKTFNLQVFLNETCKNAMNITDFVNSIQLQLTDFENVGEQGYINGISNIIIKNLKALDENMRPVHCSDLKRESIYVKDNNQWEKDTKDNQKLKKAILAIAHKNTKMIPKYREKYPDCQKSHSRLSDNYNKFVVEAMGGAGDNDDEKTDKIVKRIAKEIVINK